MKKKTCSIKEATEWFAKTCPRIYAEAKASGPVNPEDIRKAVEILKKNNNPKDHEIVITPGSYAYECLKGLYPEAWVKKDKYSTRPPSTHKRVFKKGRRIMTIAALDRHLSSGGWIFWGTQKRAVHPGWVMSWQYNMVRNSLGRMWKAVRI